MKSVCFGAREIKGSAVLDTLKNVCFSKKFQRRHKIQEDHLENEKIAFFLTGKLP
jgi:hypothetical protein